jgi:hypothetical protein
MVLAEGLVLFGSVKPFVLLLDIVGDLFGDMTIVLKIFVLLAIVSYVTQHFGKGPLALIIIAVISYLVVFDYFLIFGGIYILYMLVMFGVTQLLMDFFILAPQAAMEQSMGHGGPDGKDAMDALERQRHFQQLRARAGMR